MRGHQLILSAVLVISSVIPTQAAVYGTLKREVTFKYEAESVVKKSGSGISIIGQDDRHYLVKVNDEATEQIQKDWIELPGVISQTIVEESKLKVEPTQDSPLLLTLKKGELVMVLEKVGNYYKVKVDNQVGYIYKGQVDTRVLSTFEKSPSERLGEEIVECAKQYIGGKYVYGGNNLKTGVDCSGFVQQIMKQFDIEMERSSRSQYAANGKTISQSHLKPGDLVFYGYKGRINHVAIYAGEGQIVHASDARTGIIMGDLYYGQQVIGYKRVV